MADNLHLLEINEDHLLLRQQFDAHGVCIVPTKQDKAALKLIEKLGKTYSGIEGDKRTAQLKYYFEPSLTEEEYEKWSE